MGDLVYILAEKTIELPEMECAINGKFYRTYKEAEEAIAQLPDNIRDECAVFTAHCIVQQEVQYEVPF